MMKIEFNVLDIDIETLHTTVYVVRNQHRASHMSVM